MSFEVQQRQKWVARVNRFAWPLRWRVLLGGAVGDVSDGELGEGARVSRTETQALEPGELGFASQPGAFPGSGA